MISGTVSVNIISEDTEIEGKITTQSDFRIGGTVRGELEIKGKCIITETGTLSGDMVSNDADIAGTVDGSVLTANRLILRSTARITGNIYTKTILMEEGAIFQGECRMGSDPLKSWKKSKSESTAAPANGQASTSQKTASDAATTKQKSKPGAKQPSAKESPEKKPS